MKKPTFHSLVVFLLIIFAAMAFAELPRDIIRLKRLDKIVDVEQDTIETEFHVLVIFKACCTPNEQAINWASELYKKQHHKISMTGLNVDKPRQISKVKNWLYARDVDFTVYSDPSGQEAVALKTVAPPSVIIYNEEGKEIYRTLGFRANDRKKLNTILGITE